MCECEMYKMWADMECQYLTEDTKVRVCLSMVPGGKKETGKDSIPERIVLLAIKLFFAYSVAYFVYPWAIQSAYNERGYEAYGGEYILVLAVFMFAYKMISLFFKYFRREKAWKRKK